MHASARQLFWALQQGSTLEKSGRRPSFVLRSQAAYGLIWDMSTGNPYCEALGIQVPRLEEAKSSREANTYSLLIAVLLERGRPITLVEAAKRMEEAGVARADRALAALQRCKPARPPIYRDGDVYALDPHDHEADLWAFRLGLRPPKMAPPARPDPGPLPSADEPLTVAALDEAWRDGIPNQWSAQRIATCVLDAHETAMPSRDVLAFVRGRSERNLLLSADSAGYWRRGAAIRVREGGRWELDREHDAVRSARVAVRERIASLRRSARLRPDPAVIEATRKRFEMERKENRERFSRLRRVLVHAFPPKMPEAVVMVDVERRDIAFLKGEAIAEAREKLAAYDVIAGLGVRSLVRALDFEPGERHLAELGPPQKTKRLNKRGRTLEITADLLARGSCGIGRPFGDGRTLHEYLRDGKHTKLRRRLESDAKSLFALYQYGRLHGAVRLRWGFLDERIPAPWVHRDEPTLYDLQKQARDHGVPLEVVVGSAPGWADPWSRMRLAYVETDDRGWRTWLVDEQGYDVDEADVQLARLANPDRWER